MVKGAFKFDKRAVAPLPPTPAPAEPAVADARERGGAVRDGITPAPFADMKRRVNWRRFNTVVTEENYKLIHQVMLDRNVKGYDVLNWLIYEGIRKGGLDMSTLVPGYGAGVADEESQRRA